MPYNPMEGLSNLAKHRQGITERKQASVAKASQDKQNDFNPLNMGNVKHVDGDTFQFLDSGQYFRASSDPSYGVDTYESDEQRYVDDPDRFKNHRRNYAKLTGKPEWTITKKELADRGRAQSEQTKLRMQELGSQGLLDYRVTGTDAYGRAVVDLVDRRTGGSFFADHSGREQNASYDSKYNAGKQLDDFFSGQTGEETRFTGSRSFKDMLKDQVPNLAVGAGRMLNDIGQAASVITGTNSDAVDEFFSNNRDRLDRFKKRFTSKEQQGRERLAQKNAARNAELYETRKNQYLADGDDEGTAKFKAGVDEFKDGVRNLLQNPGRILDATVESLPYMIGVGAVGRKAMTTAAKQLNKKAVDRVVKNSGGKVIANEKVAENAATAARRLTQSKAGQAYLKRVSTSTGVGTVGLTEGLSVSAEVYDSIIGMSEEEALKSEHYQALRFDQDKTHKEALKILAEDAFDSTILPMIGLAATASLATGAAGLESRLFSDLVRKGTGRTAAKAATKEATEEGAKKVVKESLTGKVIKGTGKRLTGPSARAGGKEALEESIQSGGGELLSQIGKQDATGEEVGPGIGAATAEGAVVGFASGASMVGVSNAVKTGLRKAATAKLNSNDFIKKTKERATIVPPAPEDGGDGPPPRPGGSTVEAQQEVDANRDAGKDSGKAFEDELAAFDNNMASEEGNAFTAFNRLAQFHEAAKRDGKVSPANEARYQAYKEVLDGAVADQVREVSKKDPKDYTNEDRAIINAAAETDSVPKEVEEQLPEDAQEVVRISRELNDLRQKAEKIENPAVTARALGSSTKRADIVHNEKFGDGIGSTGPGLGWYFNEISEVLSEPNEAKREKRAAELFQKLGGFVNSQQRKIDKYEKVLADPTADHGKLKYVAPKDGTGGTEAFVESLYKERDAMAEIHDKLLAKYRVWNGTSKQVQNVQNKADNLAPQPLREPPKTETKAKAKEEDKNAPQPLSKPPKAKKDNAPAKGKSGSTTPAKKTTRLTREQMETAAANIGIKTDISKLSDTELETLLDETSAKNKKASEEAAAKRAGEQKQRPALEIHKKFLVQIQDMSAEGLRKVIANRKAKLSDYDGGIASIIEAEIQLAEEKLANVEQEAEPDATQEPTEETLNILSTEERVADARRLKARVSQGTVGPIELVNRDNARLQELLQTNTPTEALEQLISEIEPDPAKRNTNSQPKLDDAVVDQAVEAASQLNKLERAKAVSMIPRWRNFLSMTAEIVGHIKGSFTNSTNAPLSQLPTLIKSTFARHKLPTSMGQVFEQKSDTTTSLFSAVPDIMAILENRVARNKIYDALELSQSEERAMDTFRAFHKQFALAFETRRRKLNLQLDHAGTDMQEDSTHFFEDDTNTVDPNVVAAMALEAMNWVTTSGARTIENDAAAINAILGRQDSHPISDEESRVLTYAGTVRNQIAWELGNAIFNHLNVRYKRVAEVNPMFKHKLIASLGSHAVATLIHTDRIENRQVDSPWFQAQKEINEENETTVFESSDEKKVNFIRNKTEQVERFGEVMLRDKNADLAASLQEGHGVFRRLFASRPSVRMPSFDQPTDVPNTISRALTKISQKMRKRMLYNSQKEWFADTEKLDLLARFGGKEFLAMAMDYKTDEQVQNTHILERDSVKGRNEALERDYQAAMEWGRRYKDRPFYFNYKMIRSGRIYIDSNVINPQANKIHRWLFGMREWQNTISTATNGKSYENFLIAVGAGLGIAPDKTTRKKSLEQIQEILDNDAFQEAIDILAENTEEKFTPAQLEKLRPFLKRGADVGGEGVHTLAAMQAYAKFKHAKGDKVTVMLPVETDGITNGFIAGLLQTPSATLSKAFKDMLRAGGIALDDDTWTNYPAWKEEPGNYDNYEQIARGTSVRLKQMLLEEFVGREFEDPTEREIYRMFYKEAGTVFESGFLPNQHELNTPEGRKWAKNPLMVVSYGASINSVRKALSRTALSKFYEQLSSATSEDEVVAVMLKAYKLVGLTNDIMRETDPSLSKAGNLSEAAIRKRIKTEGGWKKFSLNFVMNDRDSKYFQQAVEATYGEAIGDALEEKMAPLKELRTQLNHANKLMNLVFVKDFMRRVKTLEGVRQAALTPDDRRAIFDQMQREGLIPSVATAFSDNVKENLETTSYETEYLGGKDGKGEAHFDKLYKVIEEAYVGANATPSGSKSQKSIWTRIMSNLPNADVGVSGVVKLIHSLDGVNNSEAWGTKWGVLNIHDAQVGNFNQIDEIAKATNKNFLEMHAGFSLGDEVLKSTFRMMSLMNENDSRLSNQDKNAVYNSFVNHLVKFGYIKASTAKKQDPRRITENFLAEMQGQVVENNKARKELFGQIRAVNQFAKEGAEHIVEENAVGEINQDAILHNLELPIKDLLTRFFNTTQKADIYARKEEIDTLVDNLRRGDINAAFIDYVDRAKPNAREMLEVLQAVYNRTNQPIGKAMALLNNLLFPYLGDTKIEIVDQLNDPKAGATFSFTYADANTGSLGSATIRIKRDSQNLTRELFHEILHAGTIGKLYQLQHNDPEAFTELLKAAIQWANKEKVRENKEAEGRVVSEEILVYRKEKPVLAVGEYLAYIFTEAKDIGGNLDSKHQNMKDPYTMLKSLDEVLSQTPSGIPILRSSGKATKAELFKNSIAQMLETSKAMALFEALDKYEQGPIDQEHQNTLREVMRDLAIPGLASIEKTIQQVIAVDPYATEHIGEAEGDMVRLQAAGNPLTTNVDMSLQEVAVHEYLHPIMKYGIRNNHFIRKETRRLYELAKANLTVDDFLPETIVGNPDIAMEKAQRRYDYIFNNPETGYDEFLSIGLTNKPMIEALKALDNKNIPQPILGQGILNAMFEVARRIVQWLGGQSRESHGGNAHMALTALAKTIIATNQRNLQRTQDAAGAKDPGYWLDTANNVATDAITDRIVSPLKDALSRRDRKKLDPKNPNLKDFLKSATYVGLTTRDNEVRKEYNRFYRSMNGQKNNWFFDIVQEFTPWNEQNLGTKEQPGWLDLLRKSKVVVDKAREEINNATRKYLVTSLDKNNYLTMAHKQAITRVMLKTDISSLMAGDSNMTASDIQSLLNNPDRIDSVLAGLMEEMKTQLAEQSADKLYYLFDNHSNSLASFMVNGTHTLDHGMNNTHNIVHQHMLPDAWKVPLQNKAEMVSLVDRITTLKALKRTSPGDIKLALDMVNHEMAREDVAGDDGFTRLLGMQISFQKLSQERLFDNDPTQMIKGYVYEIYDPDTNVEYALNTPEAAAEMTAKGMRWVADLPKDKLDKHTPARSMWIGNKGLGGYNKSIVSLTDIQHRGVNLHESLNYSGTQTYRAVQKIRSDMYKATRDHFKPNYSSPGTHMVPVLDSQGNIVEYRYMMSESNKEKLLKKQDPFDRVLPRMMASITDRNSTKDINREVVDLLWTEYDELGDHPEHAFVKIGKNGDAAGKEMWNLLPDDMQKYATEKFGNTEIYIRDDVVNLVLGFRKMSISNGKMFGKVSPIVKMADKVWLETVKLMRAKIAVLTPRVVVGNMASNTAMLLSEGIRPSYIRRKATEAISAMRAYQKDVAKRDELILNIQTNEALGKNTRHLEIQLVRIRKEIDLNPVHHLVEEGLFTSITEDLGIDDDTIRGSLITKAEDRLHDVVPKSAITAVKELYMLPGSRGFKAGVAATQYGDFVARFVKYEHDTKVKGKDPQQALNDALAAFIYYDIPQDKRLQFANDYGLAMFTKFFLRIQPIVARMYTQNPVGAFGVLGLQAALLPKPFSENIAQYGLGSGLTRKPTWPWNVPGKAADTLDPSEPALIQWLLNPFGL